MAGYIGSKASVVSSGAERKKVFNITTSTTVLTGLSYTANQVHVFHNGVRLISGTDYTETNDTTITLTNAAENGDQVVVVSYASFQTSDTVSASAGGTFSGAVDVNADGATVLTVDRATSDGTIIDVQKNGSTVGSIGVYSSDNLYLQGKSDHSGLAFGEAEIYGFRNNSENDGVTSLGSSAARFKDLYLSGGVYLGGTGSANYLDDYEEGTWTPTAARVTTNPTVSYNKRDGSYIKIGNLVFVTFDFNIGSVSGGAGNALITGLPFTVSNTNDNFAGYGVAQWRDAGAVPTGPSGTQIKGFCERGNTYIALQYDNSGSSGFATQSNVGSWRAGRATGYIMYAAAP